MSKPLFFMASLVAAAAPSTVWADTAQPTEGRAVFDRWCGSCHGPKTDSPGTGALAAKYNGEIPARLDQRTDLTPDVVKYFVRHGVSVMPPFRKTEITDSELESLALYLSRDRK